MIDFESITSTDLYFFENGISIFDSDTTTSSRSTDCDRTEIEKNKSDILK